MKRHGQLMEAIAEPANLRLAFWKAAKSKRAKADCRAFQDRLEEDVVSLRAELLSGSVDVGDYHTFTFHDPKERTICAAMSYARQSGWFLKMDIRKYFDSIDQEVLRGLLRRRFKDVRLMEVFDRILATYQTAPGRGLPIGNLTSQHFAHYYLAPLDRFLKEGLQCRSYVRYMDDFVVWGETAAELREVWRQVEAMLAAELKLELKFNVMLNRTECGMDFLGYRIFPDDLRLAKRSKRRFASKFRAYEREHRDGVWSELELQQRMTSLIAFTLPCRSRGFRRNMIERFGAEAKGLQPRAARRQLEQQRQQRALCQPQQQQPGQRQQQQRLSGCSGPSSTRWPERRLADPAAVPSPDPLVLGEETKQGAGVSSGEHSAKAPDLLF